MAGEAAIATATACAAVIVAYLFGLYVLAPVLAWLALAV